MRDQSWQLRHSSQLFSSIRGHRRFTSANRPKVFEGLEARVPLDGDGLDVSGPLPSGVVVWSADEGPYHVTGDVQVPADTTLRIEAGTAVYFDEGLELDVRGTLIAMGTPDQRIRFSSVPDAPFVPDRPNDVQGLPDGPPRWKGIHFRNSRFAGNAISLADVDYAQSDQGSIGVISSNAVIDDVRFSGTHLRMVYADDASLAVRNSHFPDMFGPDESPAALGLDNISEHIKITGRPPADGTLIIQANTFGTNKGHNDVIDADSGRRPDPILQILDNVFAGAGDELLDLGGDVYVAGNVFQNVQEDDDNPGLRFANAISTGDAGANATVVVTRNIFQNIEHAMHLRTGDAAIFEQNTVVNVHPPDPGLGSALALYSEAAGELPGRGAHVSGNIFWDVPSVFGNIDQPADQITALRFDNNLVSDTLAATPVGNRATRLFDLGIDNLLGEPRFVDAERHDFRLAPGSAAIGAGFFGQDLGANVPAGALITGEPVGVTPEDSAGFTVGGPGIFAFRYRVNNADWSNVIPIGNGFDAQGTVRTAQIELVSLSPGTYSVEVLGQDFAGNWQTFATRSRTWVVAPMPGDLNGDSRIDVVDVDLLCIALQLPVDEPNYDLNRDDQTSAADLDHLVSRILGTGFGDANVDRVFDSTDLVEIFSAGEYEDDVELNSVWSEGDWNADGDFDSSDLVLAFQAGLYEIRPAAVVQISRSVAVPRI